MRKQDKMPAPGHFEERLPGDAWKDGQWGWGGYGNQAPPPVPNNNVGIGYPTAYGLMVGRPPNGGHGPMPHGHGTGFGSPLRCLNGGAHIGQCRLDQDSICIALGGTCIHGSCCTTPFSGLNKATSQAPVIEGDVSAPMITRPTTTPLSEIEIQEETSEEDEVKREREEMSKIIASALTTLTPTTTKITVTVAEVVDHATQCDSGLRAVGPCAEDSDCPTLHRCETNMCCYVVD